MAKQRSGGTDAEGNAYSTEIPQDVRDKLGAYNQNQGSYSARNAVFQALYNANQGAATDIAGQNAEGYNALLGAINHAYGVDQNQLNAVRRSGAKHGQSSSGQQSAQAQSTNAQAANANIIPGLNRDENNSTLSVLYR